VLYSALTDTSSGLEDGSFDEVRLDEVLEVYDAESLGPCNVWPLTREWLLATDFDLPATRVTATDVALDDVAADSLLETTPAE